MSMQRPELSRDERVRRAAAPGGLGLGPFAAVTSATAGAQEFSSTMPSIWLATSSQRSVMVSSSS